MSGRAQQAHTDIATHTGADDLTELYNVQEGLTRAEHASHLNSIDQFTREAFERGATLTEGVLSIPKDPDSRPRDDSKVIIGTEAHAINFVRGFIEDPAVATEKGKLLFELGNKACGQWIDSDGRLAIFNHIYTAIRQDPAGAYRTNEQKAEVIDKVLEETALWAQQLPEPTPEPTAEQVHEFTLALAEENQALTLGATPEPEQDDQTIGLEQQPTSLYLEHLQSLPNGLATIGELSGYSDQQLDTTLDGPSIDENQIYADMYEAAISDHGEFATPEGDHLGAEREAGTSVTLEATYDRINLAALPPQIPDNLSLETQSELLDHLLPYVDSQIERGASKRDILAPLYENNREAEQRGFENQVTDTFTRAGSDVADRPLSRIEELQAVSSLRILVGAEYRQQTKPFTREAILWAKENYRVNPDWLRSEGKLQKGEYQKIVIAQTDARANWLRTHPGQQVPTRAEITSINRLEQSGHKLNGAIAGINPTPQEHAQVLDRIQSQLNSARASAETLLNNFERAETASTQLAHAAQQFADHIRATPEFQELQASIQAEARENSIDKRQILLRSNNARFNNPSTPNAEQRGSNYPELTGDARPLSPYAQISLDNEIAQRDALQTLADTLISADIENAQALNNADLANYRELSSHLTGTTIANAAEAREAIAPKLESLDKASAVVDATRTRFGITEAPNLVDTLAPTPAYVSLTASPNVRVPVETIREYDLLFATAEECRLDTSVWSSLNTPHAISGADQERADLARFVSNYIDYRFKDHTTQELSSNPTFRNYSERLAAARTPEELIQASSQIRLENYQQYQQLLAHRADPASAAAPQQQPLTVMEMREVFLSTSPTAVTSADREEMKDILQSMAVFGKEKTERVQLLIQGKIEPSPTLSKLLTNLDTRQTVRAVNHFYSSLRTPADQLQTQNRFDLHKAHERLPQYERDFLHNHALAQKYESVNQKIQGTQLTPEQTSKTLPAATQPTTQREPLPAKTDFYREYYGRADWLEAQNVVTAAAKLERGAAANLDRSTIVPELKDVEVQAINYVVNNFDAGRQQQVADQLKSSPDTHQQAIGELITTASEIKIAGAAPDVKEVELQIPTSYALSPDSVTTVIQYTQQETARATEATRLPATELSDLRQEAQAQAWRDMGRDVIKDPAQILDAPAQVVYHAQELTQGIAQTAELQERARTAFQVLNGHTATCVEKAEQAIAREQTTQPFRSPEQQQTTRELVNVALNPELQETKAELIQNNSSEYALIQQTLTTADKEQSALLRDYAANTRAEYLQAFPALDRDQQVLKDQEARPVSETRTVGEETALDRYTTTRDEIARTTLGERVQEMVQTNSLPALPQEQLATLTVKDLLPPDVRELAVEQAREPAWQSLEPQELRDLAAGREVEVPLEILANEVMDQVAIAQTIELQLVDQQIQISDFVAEQVALVEAPLQAEQAALAYVEEFRETLTAIANDPTQGAERVDAANQILTTLDRAELDPATLVNQATNQELDQVPADIVIEANLLASNHAEHVRTQPVFTTPEARETVQQQVITDLTGAEADRFAELNATFEEIEEKFRAATSKVDEKSTELELSRAELAKETELQQFRDLAKPAAVEINDYFRDTVRDEGLPALLEPGRFEQHVQELANVIIETGRNNGITLGNTAESTLEVNQIATDLFKTLAPQMERANTQLAVTQQLTHQIDTSTNQLLTNNPQLAAGNNRTSPSSPDQRDQQRLGEEQNRQRQDLSVPHQDLSGKQPTAQDVAKAPDITTELPGGGLGAAELEPKAQA